MWWKKILFIKFNEGNFISPCIKFFAKRKTTFDKNGFVCPNATHPRLKINNTPITVSSVWKCFKNDASTTWPTREREESQWAGDYLISKKNSRLRQARNHAFPKFQEERRAWWWNTNNRITRESPETFTPAESHRLQASLPKRKDETFDTLIYVRRFLIISPTWQFLPQTLVSLVRLTLFTPAFCWLASQSGCRLYRLFRLGSRSEAQSYMPHLIGPTYFWRRTTSALITGPTSRLRHILSCFSNTSETELFAISITIELT